MNTPSRTIVLSDLHIGHPSSNIQEPAQLLPIIREGESVVFNGDTVESLWQNHRRQAASNLSELSNLCSEENTNAVFITGNHDPRIPGCDHLELAGGKVLVTHGDVLFHDIAPWCPKDARIVGKVHRRILSKLKKTERFNLEKRLRTIKRAVKVLENHCLPLNPGPLQRLSLLYNVAWPPSNLWRILKTWRETPARAAALARYFRPAAKFVLIGHTHRAGVWRVGRRVIVNTGSFLPFSKRYAVILEGSLMELRRIVRVGDRFELDRLVTKFSLREVEPAMPARREARADAFQNYLAYGIISQ